MPTLAREPNVGDRYCRTPVRCRPPTFFGLVFQRLDQRRPPTSVQLADIQASVGHRHCWSNFLTIRPTLAADIDVSVRQTLTDVSLSVGKLDPQCRRPTLADTPSVTLVIQDGKHN